MNRTPAHYLIAGIAISLIAACASDKDARRSTTPYADQACQKLATDLRLQGSSVDTATYVAAGFVPPGAATPVGQAFCRVQLTSRPSTDSDIRSEVWMPTATLWNGRFLATGGGGNSGAIIYPRLVDGLARGYAVLSTDNGHIGKSAVDQSWAIGHPEKVVDFGHRAQVVAAAAGKEIVRGFYGEPARKSYWIGCSQGGGKGLMQAQRYPQTFDGIVAGAPVFDWVGSMFSPAWVAIPGMRDAAQFVPKDKLRVIHKAVLAACDANDGVTDGLIQTPGACKFDPASMACPVGQDAPECLTSGQVNAMKRFYSPIKTSDGMEVFPGFPRGAELASAWLGTLKPGGNWNGFWTDVVYENPDYDVLSRLDVAGLSDYHRAKAKVSAAYDALDPDLEPFARRGGKLIIWHGWHDELVSALRTESYVRAVTQQVGAARADTFMHTYLAPGVNHCRGGVGPIPDEYDLLAKVVSWVEKGETPAAVTGAHRNADGVVDRTMPLCPYPQVARYKGSGDIKDGANFVCGAP